MIALLDLTDDSGQNEVFFVKIEDRVLDLWFMGLIGPNCWKLVSKVIVLGSKIFFILRSIKVCVKQALIFKI